MAGRDWHDLLVALPYLAVGTALAAGVLPALNALRVGDLRAQTVGLDVARAQWTILASASLLAAASVDAGRHRRFHRPDRAASSRDGWSGRTRARCSRVHLFGRGTLRARRRGRAFDPRARRAADRRPLGVHRRALVLVSLSAPGTHGMIALEGVAIDAGGRLLVRDISARIRPGRIRRRARPERRRKDDAAARARAACGRPIAAPFRSAAGRCASFAGRARAPHRVRDQRRRVDRSAPGSRRRRDRTLSASLVVAVESHAKRSRCGRRRARRGAHAAVGGAAFFDAVERRTPARVDRAWDSRKRRPSSLLDEPTSHLDIRVAHEILGLLRALAREGKNGRVRAARSQRRRSLLRPHHALGLRARARVRCRPTRHWRARRSKVLTAWRWSACACPTAVCACSRATAAHNPDDATAARRADR